MKKGLVRFIVSLVLLILALAIADGMFVLVTRIKLSGYLEFPSCWEIVGAFVLCCVTTILEQFTSVDTRKFNLIWAVIAVVITVLVIAFAGIVRCIWYSPTEITRILEWLLWCYRISYLCVGMAFCGFYFYTDTHGSSESCEFTVIDTKTGETLEAEIDCEQCK